MCDKRLAGTLRFLMQHRPAKVIALDEREAFGARLLVLVVGFDLFSDQRHGVVAQLFKQFVLALGPDWMKSTFT